ncbi:MaoC family dehydratase [Alcaligenes sp. YSL9]|uniref:MaoC family dehydratase n=1 Tax=Alcaligenes sp. YSL9 TaxID=2939596 RepID=UPI00266D8D76|nr:MaoC family dehydratase [Alcaligenes sp. YSL9]
MSLTAPVYLEDLALGMEFRSAEHALDEAQIISFARQFDPQPFHLDAEAAKGTFFQGLAASGWHTAAITMKLLVDSLVFNQGIIGAGGQIDWPRPTRPGDVLHVLSKIIDIQPSRSKADRGMVVVESHTLNQNNEVCQRLIAKLIAFRRPEV